MRPMLGPTVVPHRKSPPPLPDDVPLVDRLDDYRRRRDDGAGPFCPECVDRLRAEAAAAGMQVPA